MQHEVETARLWAPRRELTEFIADFSRLKLPNMEITNMIGGQLDISIATEQPNGQWIETPITTLKEGEHFSRMLKSIKEFATPPYQDGEYLIIKSHSGPVAYRVRNNKPEDILYLKKYGCQAYPPSGANCTTILDTGMSGMTVRDSILDKGEQDILHYFVVG